MQKALRFDGPVPIVTGAGASPRDAGPPDGI
jgi:hypothetical protein